MDSTSSSRPPSRLQQRPPSRLAAGGQQQGRRSPACGGAGGPSTHGVQQQHRRRPPSYLDQQQQEAATVVDRMDVDPGSSTSTSTSKRSRSVTPPTGRRSSAAGQQEEKRRRLVLHLLPRGQTPPPSAAAIPQHPPAAVSQGFQSPAPPRRWSFAPPRRWSFAPPPVSIPPAHVSPVASSGARTEANEEEEEEEDQELVAIAARIPSPPPAPTNDIDQPRPIATPKQPPVLPESDSCEEAAADATAQFTCPVCLSLLARPVTLECGFSLCEGCVAQALHHAWAVRGTRTAPCPVLGPSCAYPLARLPRVNTLLHAALSSKFPTKYAERLAEARASPTHAITARVQAHSAKLSLRPYYVGGSGGLRYRGGAARRQWTGLPPPPAALALDGNAGAASATASAMGYDHGHEEEEEDLEEDGEILGPLLSHLRFSLPFLLALAISLSLPPTTTTPPHPSSLASNAFALLLTSTLGSHWLVWSFLEATVGGGGNIQGLGGFRHLLADVKLRLCLAAGFPPGLGFACTWLLLASVVELCSNWTRLAAARLRLLAADDSEDDDDDDDSNSPVRWAVSELLVLLGSSLWFELVSLAAYNMLQLFFLLPTSPSFVHALLTSPRIHRLYNTLWYTGVFVRIIVLPFLPKPRLTQHIRTLRALRRLPPWQAILLDPRIEMLHCFSSLEARLLSRGLAALKTRVILFLIQRQQQPQPGRGQEEGEGEEERVPTPRAPRAVVGGEQVPAH